MKFQKVVRMVSADIKTDVKQEIKKNWQMYYIIFHRSFFSKLVSGIPCSLILPIKNGANGDWGRVGVVVNGFLLKDQNLLSMTKFICRGSLSGWLLSLGFKVYFEKFIPCLEMQKFHVITRVCVLVHRPAWLTEQFFYI